MVGGAAEAEAVVGHPMLSTVARGLIRATRLRQETYMTAATKTLSSGPDRLAMTTSTWSE